MQNGIEENFELQRAVHSAFLPSVVLLLAVALLLPFFPRVGLPLTP